MANVVIVGGGPAGIRAASVLVEAGLRPILVNETRQVGGQGYRMPAKSLALDIKALMGSEAGNTSACIRCSPLSKSGSITDPALWSGAFMRKCCTR